MMTKPSRRDPRRDDEEQQEQQARRRSRARPAGCGGPDGCRGRSCRPARPAAGPPRARRRLDLFEDPLFVLAEGHRFLPGRGERSSLPIIGVGAEQPRDLECRRMAQFRRSRSISEAGRAAPRPNRSSIRSTRSLDVAPPLPAQHRELLGAGRDQPARLHPQQPDPPALPGQRAVQLRRRCGRDRRRCPWRRERPGPGERREVRQAGLQDDRPGAVAVLAQARRHPSREVEQLPQDVLVGVQVPLERLLVAHRLRRLVRHHVAVVDAVRQLVEVTRRRSPEQALQDGLGRAAQVADRADPQSAEGLAGLLPHAPQAPDRQRLEERLDPVGGDHEHARSGLQSSDASFATNFVGRHADRARHADLALDVGAGSSPRSRPRTRTASWRPRRPGTPRRARSAPRAACRSSRTSRNRLEWAR